MFYSRKENILWSLAYLGAAVLGKSSRPLTIARNLEYLSKELKSKKKKK